MKIYSITTFANEKGIDIKQLINIEDAKDTKFEADIMVTLGPGMALPVHINFPLTFTLKDCFEKFDELIKKEVEEMIKKEKERVREENLIIPAGNIPDWKKNQNGFSLT